MCLYLISGPHKCRKDKVVYKGLNRFGSVVYSPFYTYAWEKGAKNPTIKLFVDMRGIGNRIDRGYHAYKSVHNRFMPGNVVGKFIIPKGAEYYLGTRGDIVASDMIFEGLID